MDVNLIDIIVTGVVLLLGYAGFRQGLVVGLCSLVGFVAGMYGATRIAQHLLAGGTSSPYAPIWGASCALALAVLFSAAMEGFGISLRDRIHTVGAEVFDRALGALLALTLGLVGIWISAAILVGVPQLRTARAVIVQSKVIQQLNEALPPTGNFLNLLSRYDPLPTVNGPRILVESPDAATVTDPQVRAASNSVVRVVGTACGFAVTGSGWVARPHIVVTNAHVIAGEEDTSIRLKGSTTDFRTKVLWFDPVQDLAVLYVPKLERAPLPIAKSAIDSSNAAVLGYPENGPFDSRPARINDTRLARAPDIYNGSETVRSVTSFRAVVRHGNSGGPVVDDAGRVVATVFATTVGSSVRGGYGVPNDQVREALNHLSTDGAVDTGGCTSS